MDELPSPQALPDRLRRPVRPLPVAIVGTALLMAVTVVLALWRGEGGAPVVIAPWFVPLTNGFVSLVALCVAFLAFGRWLLLREPAAFCIGMAFSGFALGMLLNILTFPGLVPGGQQLVGHLPNTSAWVSVVSLQLVGLSLLLAVVLPGAGAASVRPGWWAIPAWVLGVLLLDVSLVLLEDHLPALVTRQGAYANHGNVVVGVLLLLESAVGAALSTRRVVREGSGSLLGYVALCQVTLVAVAVLLVAGHRRFDFLWSVQRILAAAGFLAVFLGLLVEYVVLVRRERDQTVGLRESEDRVRDLNHSLERRYAELEAERTRWRGVVEGIAEELWVCDAEGRMSLVNLPAATALGLKEFEGKTIHEVLEELEVLDPEGRPRPPREQPLLRSLRTGEVVRGEEMVRSRTSGRLRFRQFSSAPTRDAGGAITGAVSIVRDVTQARLAERALQEADRRKDHFMAMLSHELRNPLAPIRNCLYILDRSAPDGEAARRARQTMARQVDHLTRLVEDLLDVSRVSRGKVELDRQRLELGELVQRTVEDHRSLFTGRGLEVVLQEGDQPLWVNGDATRLAQVLGNLLQNAAKFTPLGGRVRVALSREGATAVLRVRDTGVGIPPEVLPHVFEPFTQADRTLDRAGGGLGLGLSLVKGLVTLHGGEVEVRSDGPDLGAEFVVRLPIEAAPERRAQPPLQAPGAGPARPRRVLVIEDHADSAESLRSALELQGHAVSLASTGPEGLARAGTFRPEVVLCDIGLPEMSGYDVARALRADEAFREVVLVALTGYAGKEDRERAARAGFDLHLAKPPDLEAIRRLLAGELVRPVAEVPAGPAPAAG